MATREENLKKINNELEKLDDEQLEKIAGSFNQLYQQNPRIFQEQNPPQPSQIKDSRYYAK